MHPALDVRLFSSWTFSASTLAALLCYSCTAAVNFTAPFLLIRACGLPESRAGLALMAIPVAMLLLTAPSGYLAALRSLALARSPRGSTPASSSWREWPRSPRS